MKAETKALAEATSNSSSNVNESKDGILLIASIIDKAAFSLSKTSLLNILASFSTDALSITVTA